MFSTKLRTTAAAIAAVAAVSLTTGVASAAAPAHNPGDATQSTGVQTASAQRPVRPSTGNTRPVMTGTVNVALEGHSSGEPGSGSEQWCNDQANLYNNLITVAVGAANDGNSDLYNKAIKLAAATLADGEAGGCTFS